MHGLAFRVLMGFTLSGSGLGLWDKVDTPLQLCLGISLPELQGIEATSGRK